MWPFRPKLPIDQDELDFQLATFKRLIAGSGPVADRTLILPNPDFFPLTVTSVAGATGELFEQVSAHAAWRTGPASSSPAAAITRLPAARAC
jgi:hypothetical protein